MSNKLEKLNNLLALMQNDTITPAEVEKFLVMVLKVIKDSKENMEALSQESLSQMKEALEYISSEHQELLSIIDGKNSKLQNDITAKIEEAKKLLKEVKSVKPVHGKDGKDADEEVIVDKVLGRIKMPEIDIESPESILEKLNTLDGDFKLNSSLITLPEDTMIEIDGLKRQIKNGLGGSTARNLFQLQDVQVSNIQDNDILQYDNSNNTWRNVTPQSIENVNWGEITGTITDQTDLVTYIDSKIATVDTLNEISLLSNTTAKSLYQMTAGANPEFRASDTTTLTYWDNANKRFGVGTNTIRSKFEVLGAGSNTVGISNSIIGLQSTASAAHQWGMRLGATSGELNLDSNFGGVDVNIVKFERGGNVGIGVTSSPGAKLHVVSTTEQLRVGYDTTNRLSITVDSAGIPTFAPTGNSMVFKATSPAYIINVHQSDSTATAYRLGTYADSAESEYLFNAAAEAKISGRASSYIGLTAANYFGVGVSTPLAKLHANAPSTMSTVADTDGALRLSASSVTSAYLTAGISTNGYPLLQGGRTSDSTAQALLLQPFGANVIIGADGAGSAKLHVISTTEQFRIGYDTTNRLSVTVAATGSTTFALNGTSPVFTFSQSVLLPSGTVSAPAIGFASETNSGWYRSGAGVINLSVLGTSVLSASSSALTSTNVILAPSGTVSAPSFSFASETNSGWYRSAAGTISLSIAGVQRMSTTATTTSFATSLNLNGSNTPAINFGLDNTTANILSFDSSTATTQNVQFRMFRLTNTTGLSTGLTIHSADGTAGVNGFLSAKGNSYVGVLAGNFGVGVTSPLGKFESRSSSRIQIVGSYDVDNYISILTGVTGSTTFDLVGTSPLFRFDKSIGIGTAPDASARLDVSSTTQGFLPPRMTTTQKNAIGSPATGLVVYDTTLNKLAVYTGAVWETITSI